MGKIKTIHNRIEYADRNSLQARNMIRFRLTRLRMLESMRREEAEQLQARKERMLAQF